MSGAGTGPIDWNCNGDPTEPDVAADINADGLFTTLPGYADWPAIRLEFQCTANGSANGPPPAPASLSKEPSVRELVERRRFFGSAERKAR